MNESGDQRRLSAILAADMVGYTRHMERDSDATVAAWKGARADIIDPTIASHSGRIVKHTGDGFLAEFSTVQDAVKCAIAMQGKLAECPLEFRMGVNLGDVIDDGQDIHGEGVNIAARIEALAEPGGIYISGGVHEQVRNRLHHRFEDLGEHEVKHVSAPIKVYRIVIGPPTAEVAETAANDPALPGKPSIAVLPFDNMSSDPEQEYFSDGITEDIITALSKHRWLAVIARNTSFLYKGQSVDIRRLADELSAKYVVEGSVRRAGNRIRVTAQLIDTDTGNHLWAERYDRELEDIFDVQDEITETIAARVEPEVGAAERERVARVPRRNLQAWDYYHLGAAHFFKFTAADNLEAQRLLQLSRELDPKFGEAHAWWAYATVIGMVYWETEPKQELLDEALAATNRALELDDRNAVFYNLKGRVQLARCEYSSALTECEMALSLNPALAPAYCAEGDSLSYEGRYDEAMQRFEKAVALSTNDPQRWAFLTYGALALIFKQDFETSLVWSEKAIEVPNCQYWTIAHQAVALAYLDRQDEARRSVEKLLAENPGFTTAFAEQKLFYLKRPEQLKLYLDGLLMAGVPQE